MKCEALYEQAIQSSITYYKNHHVYPYSCKGNYYYRKENFRDAFRCWTNASDVIRLYNYSRDDEEIYKEFLDIANEQIPQIMKTESSGHSAKRYLLHIKKKITVNITKTLISAFCEIHTALPIF
jgi:menin